MHNQKFNIEPGMVISHFRLEKLLGEGGMGVVYLAEDITLNRKVAIKFMHKSMLASLPTQELREQVEQRFIREAKSVAGISHTNIAQVYEANFSDDNWYIVMEFINGRPLDDILKEDGAFTEKDALRILDQTSKGLKYAWDNCKVVHRDIKPQNLMLTFDNYVKIVDLGLAKPVVEYEDDALDLTGVGIPVGTPFYMSPEQAVAGKVDYRADMFALGATIYELMTGSKTYKGKTQAMIYGKKINQEYTRLAELGVDANIAELIDKLLEPSVANRYETWEELIYDIRLVRRGQPISNSKIIPEHFDPMEDTIDETRSSFQNPAIPEVDPMAATIDEVKPAADPMADTLDENTPYDQSRVKSSADNSEADPMLETLDENTIFDESRVKSSTDNSEVDPMADTLDENTPYDQSRLNLPTDLPQAEAVVKTIDLKTPYDQSRVKSSTDNSKVQSQPVNVAEKTPYDQSRVKSSTDNSKVQSQPVNVGDKTPYDQSRVKSSTDNSKVIVNSDSLLDYDVSAETVPPEKLAQLQDNVKSDSEFQGKTEPATSRDEGPKSVKPIIFSIFAFTAIAVSLIFAFKKPPVENSWPMDKWQTYLSNQQWLSTYHDKAVLAELNILTASDQTLKRIINLFENPDLVWMNNIHQKNASKTAFLDNPPQVEKSLNSENAFTKLDNSIQTQNEIIKTFKELALHKSIQQAQKDFTLLSVPNNKIQVSSTPKSSDLISTYKKLSLANKWLERLKENKNILESLSKTNLNKNPEFTRIKSKYQTFLNSLNPYSDPLEKDFYTSSLINFKKTAESTTSATPTTPTDPVKIETSVLKAPLKEIENMLTDLEKSYSDQQYAKIDQKFLFLKELLAKASKEDLKTLNTLKEKHLLFKRTDIQLTIDVGPAILTNSRKWPQMTLKPNLNCYYAVIYFPNSTKGIIAEPAQPSDKIIYANSENKTKTFNRVKGVEVKVVCFTYFNDFQKLYSLDKDVNLVKNNKYITIEDLESFIKSVNPKHIAHKMVTLQESTK